MYNPCPSLFWIILITLSLPRCSLWQPSFPIHSLSNFFRFRLLSLTRHAKTDHSMAWNELIFLIKVKVWWSGLKADFLTQGTDTFETSMNERASFQARSSSKKFQFCCKKNRFYTLYFFRVVSFVRQSLNRVQVFECFASHFQLNFFCLLLF